jgi:hypothetical protein
MTAAIYSLHRAHPGRYLTAVESKYPEVFLHNPDIVVSSLLPDPVELQMHYPAIHQSNHRAIHFMQGWCEHLGRALGVDVPLMTNRPHLYFDKPESNPIHPYWVICSGGKNDFTNKLWPYYQRVTMALPSTTFVQVGSDEHDHPPLEGDNVINAVGKTTLRKLFDVVRSAHGIVCGVSLLMHVAAALEKPAIVLAGGREPVTWNAYPKQQYLHTVGLLGCTSTQGERGGACWRSRVMPHNDGTVLDHNTCERPVVVNGRLVSECMSKIKPIQVVELVSRYNAQYEHHTHHV